MISDDVILRHILQARITEPSLAEQILAHRRRRPRWQEQPLVLVAADHPARRTVAAGNDPWAMARRVDLIRRIARLMLQPFVDGVLVTPDIMDELAILNHWVVHHGGPDFLDNKVLIGSMNRAGLADTVFDLDDFVSAYDVLSLKKARLDAGKLLLRVDPAVDASSRTIRYVASALAELARADIPVFLEPIAVPLSTDDLVRLMGVASALGPTSRGRWLKVPMVEDFERVAQATTCPIVLLGGANVGDPKTLVAAVQRCRQAGPQVRGVLIGRGLLFPQDGADARMVVREIASLMHGGAVAEVMQWPDL